MMTRKRVILTSNMEGSIEKASLEMQKELNAYLKTSASTTAYSISMKNISDWLKSKEK